MTKVEPQPIRGNNRALLLNSTTQNRLERCVQQMRRSVVHSLLSTTRKINMSLYFALTSQIQCTALQLTNV